MKLKGERCAQVHSTGKAAAKWGDFRQRWLQTVEAVIRAAGAEVPTPTSVLYNAATVAQGPPSTAGEDGGSSALLVARAPLSNDGSGDRPAALSSSCADGADAAGGGSMQARQS